jgi:hypothetical protein
VVSPDEQKVACTASTTGSSLFFGRIEDGNQVIETKRLDYQAPTLGKAPTRSAELMVKTRRSLVGIIALAVTNEYVFAIYSGKNVEDNGEPDAYQGSHLLIYDWDGNPVRQYLLEKPLYAMGYDAAGNTVYGISYDPEGVLIEYKLGE